MKRKKSPQLKRAFRKLNDFNKIKITAKIQKKMNTTNKRFYVVTINRTNQFPYELFKSEDLQEAFNYFNALNIEDLEEETEEYELAPYDDEGLTDWKKEELKSINQPVGEWVIKSK